jgi:glycosyltransferase involved in cell wall biosynthesis
VEVSADWPGFGPQKNRALDLAQGRWVFSIDADERVPPELAAEILAVVRGGAAANGLAAPRLSHKAYEMPRLSMFCGAYMHHSGWRPDYVTRLFVRGGARFSQAVVHERLETSAQTSLGRFKSSLLHLSFSNLNEVLGKVNQYSSARAEVLLSQGRKGSLRQAILHGLWTFIRTYVWRLGFLDGRRGFMLAVSNAEGVYYRYLKMCPEFNRSRGYTP